MSGGYAIVERLPERKPVCAWPGRPGVLTLSKGWVAVNADGRVWFYSRKPHPVENIGQWDLVIAGGGMARQLGHGLFTDLPVFNPDLPWTEHIVEVGWEDTVVADQSKLVNPNVPRIAEQESIKDGWVAQDSNGGLWWYESRPRTADAKQTMWIEHPVGSKHSELNDNELVFPSSLPWTQRIVRIVNNQIVRDE